MSTEQAGSGGSSGALASLTRLQGRLSETQFAYLLLTPVFLILAVVAFWPLIETFRLSLFADNLRSGTVGAFTGISNYAEILTGDATLPQAFFDLDHPFQSALPVTVIFVVVSVFFETLIGFGQALVLDQDFRGRRWVRVAIILPWAVPIVIQGMIFYLMFAPSVGFATPVLQNLGLVGSLPLQDSATATGIVIVADVWKTSAFMALLILAGLQSVDRSLYDVARVSGASKLQQFRMITLPIVLPTVIVAMLFRTIQAARVYGLINTASSCGTVPSLSCLVVETFNGGRYGTSAAIAFITAVIIAVLVSVYIVRYAREGF